MRFLKVVLTLCNKLSGCFELNVGCSCGGEKY